MAQKENVKDLLVQITELSHQFGTADYVRGGGGNTSVKTQDTLWVKPSGTTLAGLTAESFVALNRKKLSTLYGMKPPSDPSEREALVKETMQQASEAGATGRPSVESPLHDSLSAGFVVHTHPALVNGMTCSKNGGRVCKELFPEALWLDYIDPGYTLCMRVRKEIQNYKLRKGFEPEVIFLKNHGVFAAGDEPEKIRAIYTLVMDNLREWYEKAGIAVELPISPVPSQKKAESAKQAILDAIGEDSLSIRVCGMFDFAEGPVSPDHIVYSKSYPFVGEPTADSIRAFREKNGYLPQVLIFDGMVFGVAATEKKAALALELALDVAIVKQLADAFGGIEYMTEKARQFIENWEVESYRSRQI